jgi:hypothetical protein
MGYSDCTGCGRIDIFCSALKAPVVISHLQYADDMLCIGEASVNNLWTLKAILRGFELMSGLKVNFLEIWSHWDKCSDTAYGDDLYFPQL